MKSKIMTICLMLIISVFSFTLFACTDNTYTVSFEYSEGGVVSGDGKIEKGKEVTLTCTPYEYVTFMGWQIAGTDQILSTETTYTFTPTENIVIKPIFKSSPYDVINKILNGAMNKYDSFPQNAQEWQKFSFATEFDFGFNNLSTSLNHTQNLTINLDTNINLQGSGSAIALEIKDKATNQDVFGLYYQDLNAENEFADLYINLSGNKFHYDFLKLSDILGIVNNLMKPTPAPIAEEQAERILDLREIIKNALGDSSSSPIILGVVDSILGMNNSFGLFGDIRIGENHATFELYLDAFLSSVGSILQNVNLDEFGLGDIKIVLDGLTKNYQNGGYPFIILKLDAGFTNTNNKSVLSNIDIDFSIDEDFVVDFGNATTIQANDIRFDVKRLDIKYVADNFTEIPFNKQGYKDEKINLVNLESHGTMDFISQTGDAKNVDNHMTVNLYADMNPFAILTGITNTGFDASLIDWKNLGLFNLQLYNETTKEDFLNILFNTKNQVSNSLQLFFHGLERYDAGMQAPVEINASYDINAFLKFIQSGFQTQIQPAIPATASLLTATTEPTAPAMDIKTILNIITNLLPNILDIGTKDFGEIFVNTAQDIVTTLITDANETTDTAKVKKIILEDISYSKATGVQIKLENIKRELVLEGTDIGFVVFGNSNMINLKLDNFMYGSVEKDSAGNYLNNKNEKINDAYAKLHNTAVKILSVPELDNLKLVAGVQLTELYKNKFLYANVINIDGTKTYINTETEEGFKVHFADILFEKGINSIGKQKVKFILRSANTSVDNMLYNMVNFPISMFTYETEIEVVPAPSSIDEITFKIDNIVFEAGRSVVSLGTATYAGNTIDLKVVNDNGAFAGNIYNSGKFDVTVSAFGLEKVIRIAAYETKHMTYPDSIEVDDADMLSKITGTTLKIGSEILQPKAIQLGRYTNLEDNVTTYYDFTTNGTTALSADFITYVKTNKLNSLYIRYVFDLDGTEKIIFKEISTILMDYYVSPAIFDHPLGGKAHVLIGLYSDNVFELLTSSGTKLSDFKKSSKDFKGTYHIDGNTITLTTTSNDIATGTIENGILHLDLSSFKLYSAFPLPSDVNLQLN